MKAIRQIKDSVGMVRALELCGASRNKWYHKKKGPATDGRRRRPDDDLTWSRVLQVAGARPAYGTRRMAAQLARDHGAPTNRKKIQRLYRMKGWIEPKKTKSQIIRSNKELPRPSGPGRFWEADMSYVWCGESGWCYCFNVVDVYTREWLAYRFERTAISEHAVTALRDAMALHRPDVPGLTVRVDNGPQYTSRGFRQAARMLGVRIDYIYVNTPQQNGHIESFHKTLKKEYVWPNAFESYLEALEFLREAHRDYNHERIHSALGYVPPAEFAERSKRGQRAPKTEVEYCA